MLSYIALNGSLGTGFKETSLERGVAHGAAFIGADSGSTDGGPYYLGSGAWIWSDRAYERDLGLGLAAAHRLGVPLIIGTCGGGGGDAAVDGYAAMVDRLATEHGFAVRVACVQSEVDRRLLVDKYRSGKLRPLPGAPALDEATLQLPGHVVAMAGAEPIQDALALGADVVLLGRCADAAIFAAIPLAEGYDPGPVWNAAKIVECGSAAAENRKGQDSMLCTFDDDGFVLEPLDPDLRCTPNSVAAHTLYETADPYRLTMPSGTLDARTATYEALDERRVRVRGGTFAPSDAYTAKLEGAAPVGYLSSFWGSVRDPVILRQLPSWCASLREQIGARLSATWGEDYHLDLKVYGANGTTGEATEAVPREAVIVFDLVGATQEDASGMARAAYHVGLHWPVPEWRAGSITTFAHPYSAPVVDRGQVYRFTLNHAMVIDDADERRAVFRTTVHELGRR
ncbi:MAG TPA: acyclic terpene utilization AtuA family protein [Acidimicrobiales bacterium]|nr:acyclic terpene utilization AtuA family protein [Acidimicrobiales bacterium]